MTSPRLLRPLALALPLFFFLLSPPHPVLGQQMTSDQEQLAPEARARLAQAAEDSRLAPWQRDLMLRLADTGKAAALARPATPDRAMQPADAWGAEDGVWNRPVPPASAGHSAIYDPVRDRMVVFGGFDDAYSYRNDVWALSLSGAPAWTQLIPTGTPPSARAFHSAIYDPVRDRMVVFGGNYYDGSEHYLDDVWALSLSGPPAWTHLSITGTPPSARACPSAIYDPVRDCMVVFGGFYYDGSTQYLNDVWALSLSGAPAWTQLIPTGTPPSARSCHSAIYDPVRDRMVVFGGYYYDGSGHCCNDVWALSLSGAPAWTQLIPTGTPPSARYGHSEIYDPVRDRMVVFGGYYYDGSGHYCNDVWALSLSGTPAWAQLIPTGTPPSARESHTAIYDPVRDRMVVFGGYYYDGSGHYCNDVWALSLSGPPAWTQLIPTGTPPSGRRDHSAIYDPVRDRMVVFGGYDDAYSYRNDVWALSLSGAPAWTQLSPTGTPPSGRNGHRAIYDPVRDRMVVFGGRYYDGSWHYCNDVWALSLSGTPAWAQLIPTGTPPSARYGPSAIYDPVRDRMVVFGGRYYDGSWHYCNDVWALSLSGPPAWTQLIPTGTPPSVRESHTAIYDPVRDRMVVFGGFDDGFSDCNEVWALSLSGPPAWAQLSPTGTPPSGRESHTAIYDPVRDRMVVFGGFDDDFSDCNEVWALSLSGTSAWTQLSPTGTPPSARSYHSAIYDPVRDRMVVFGGFDDSEHYRNDVWELWWASPSAVDDTDSPPRLSSLRPPAPNPTRGTTQVSFTLVRPGNVQLGVYDINGRLVRRLVEGERRAGAATVTWDGLDESGARPGAGVYFVRLAGPGIHETRRVVILR